MLKPLSLIFFLSFLLCGCDLFQSYFEKPKEAELCELPRTFYPVQQATFHEDQGSYELILLNTPACFKNPLVLESVRLGRAKDSDTERARLDYIDQSHSTLYIQEGFSLTLKGKEQDPQTGLMDQVSSLWTPFLVGAAGAAVGSMIANKLSSRPQYVTPPSPSRGSTILQGLDEKNLSDSPKKLTNSRDSTYKSSTSTTSKKSSQAFGSSPRTNKKWKKSKSSYKSKRRGRRR